MFKGVQNNKDIALQFGVCFVIQTGHNTQKIKGEKLMKRCFCQAIFIGEVI